MIRVHPPVVAGALAGLAWGAEALRPAPLLHGAAWTWGGVALVVAGAALGASGLWTFRRRGTTHHPHGEPRALVTTGPYRRTRNPMYVGVTTVLLGVLLWSGSAWFLLPPLGFVLWIDRLQIPYEERKLSRLFGDEYEAYRRRVRRWL
jgi:protein-S-isoprenylcysteine O-methyltransferase Ste14